MPLQQAIELRIAIIVKALWIIPLIWNVIFVAGLYVGVVLVAADIVLGNLYINLYILKLLIIFVEEISIFYLKEVKNNRISIRDNKLKT